MVACVGLLASLNVMAASLPTASDSWAEMRQMASESNSNIQIVQPAYAQAFGVDGFFNACVDGNNLRSIQPQQVCMAGHTAHVDSGGGFGEGLYVCDQYKAQDVVLPIQQQVQECAQYATSSVDSGGGFGEGIRTCVKYNTVTVTLSTSPIFTVENAIHSGSGPADILMPLFKKAYVIPACN